MVERILIKMDDRGRVLIPKKIREKLMLKGGDILALEIMGNKVILSPVRGPRRVKARELKEVFFDAGEATFGD